MYLVTFNVSAFKRSLDISSAKAVIGTCKDMCPEKVLYGCKVLSCWLYSMIPDKFQSQGVDEDYNIRSIHVDMDLTKSSEVRH